ncbi:polyprenyl synthetase family protein [Thermomonospora echinospora]|nr:polyprenyl synthetase family protein [Thermomonospora echinospora]
MRERLTAVEGLLAESIVCDDPLLTEASRHLVEAGGKRFRPALVLLASHFGDPAAAGVVPAAVVVELTHLATLYHDDVMDEATMRRGEVSANTRWTNTVAILTGDYLFARASDLLADLGPQAVRIQARAFARLVRGQIAETSGPGPDADPLKHYLQVVADKTASLIAVSGQLGALLAGARPHEVDTITSACEKIGVAFQLSDDILDVASESEQSGKTPGTDLREGIRTLPVLHVLSSTDPADARLRDLLGRDLTDDALHAEALALLRAHPAMERARADLRRWADDARAELLTLPAIPARDAFTGLCDYVVSRTG